MKMWVNGFLFLLLLIALCCCATNGESTEHKMDPYTEALTMLTLALDGATENSAAQLQNAVEILEKVSKDNNATVAAGAQAFLAQLYEQGLKIEGKLVADRDWPKALELFTQAADAGNAVGCHAMAFAHASGWAGCPVDDSKAYFYAEQAALQNYIPAMMSKGSKLLLEGTPAQRADNCEKALDIYKVAAEGLIKLGMVPGPRITESDRLKDPAEKLEHASPEEVIRHLENEIKRSQGRANLIFLIALAQVYEYGLYGVPMDPMKALEVYYLAMEQGSAEAFSKIGTAHLHDGDLEQALDYFQPAAEAGDAAAFFGLGKIAVTGFERVPPTNQELGFEAISDAADAGHDEACEFMGNLFIALVESGEVPTEEGLHEAFLYYYRCALQGHNACNYHVAQMLEKGQGTERSCQDAALHYKAVCEGSFHASELKKARQMFGLKDEEGALHFYTKAAEEGYEVAQSSAAWAYAHKRGYKGKDHFSKAVRYYEMSAKQGNKQSISELAKIYTRGPGDVSVNFTKASFYLSVAANNGDVDAMEQLAGLYEKGQGVERNTKLAADLYKIALKNLRSTGLGPIQLVLKSGQLALRLARCTLSSKFRKQDAKLDSPSTVEDKAEVERKEGQQDPSAEQNAEVPSQTKSAEAEVKANGDFEEALDNMITCNVFMFMDLETQYCLAPSGFEECSHQSLWIPYFIENQQVLVNLFSDNPEGKTNEEKEMKCLVALPDNSISIGSCFESLAHGWNYDPQKLMVTFGAEGKQLSLGRGEGANSAQLVPMDSASHSRLAMYEAGVAGIPGMILQHREQHTCFDGKTFVQCADKDLSLRWGIELVDHQGGPGFAFYKTSVESPGQIQCLHIEDSQAVLVDCNSTANLQLWTFWNNRLQSKDGTVCLGIGPNNEGVTLSCESSDAASALNLIL